MVETQAPLDVVEIERFLSRLAFIREYGIKVVTVAAGAVTVELPFDDRFSGPPGQFPASMVGTIGEPSRSTRTNWNISTHPKTLGRARPWST